MPAKICCAIGGLEGRCRLCLLLSTINIGPRLASDAAMNGRFHAAGSAMTPSFRFGHDRRRPLNLDRSPSSGARAAYPIARQQQVEFMRNASIDRRQFIVGAQASALGLALPGLSSPAFAAELSKVTYLTPFGYLIAFVETMYSQTGGIFAKHGLDVTIEGGRGSSMAVQQVTAGNALLSRTGGTDLIKAHAKDPSIVAIAEIVQRDLFYVISAEANAIKAPKDMAGKTIGIVSASGATENILDMMLAVRDVPKVDVKREVVGNAPAAFELVKQGRIAGFIATSDTVQQLKIDKQPVLAWSTDDVALCPGQVYMTSRTNLEQKREVLAKFLASVHECMGVIAQSKDLAPVITSMLTKYDVFEAKRPDKGLAVLQNTVATYTAPFKDKLKSDPAKWTSTRDLMIKAGLIPESADQNYYDDSARLLAFS
jgi:ABC-type nitrate/sulfonate/bicarbonate transport system substrate-binding protein